MDMLMDLRMGCRFMIISRIEYEARIFYHDCYCQQLYLW